MFSLKCKCIVFLCWCCSDRVLACVRLPELAPWAVQPDCMCVCVFAAAVACLWLNIHVPVGWAQVCSCLPSVLICSNMHLFALQLVFCLYLPKHNLTHTHMPTGCSMSIKGDIGWKIHFYMVFTHKCVLEVCGYNHSTIIKIHPLLFF